MLSLYTSEDPFSAENELESVLNNGEKSTINYPQIIK